MSDHHLFGRLRYKHLQMLMMLGSSLNLHRASVSMNMSQPAASRMLQEIEDMFGCELFERLPRGMQPTALGRELLRSREVHSHGEAGSLPFQAPPDLGEGVGQRRGGEHLQRVRGAGSGGAAADEQAPTQNESRDPPHA